MSTSLLSKESSTSPAMSEDEHEDVVPPDPRGKWTSPSRNLFPPELGMSSHGLGNLSLYSMNRLERQCCMHVCMQPERDHVTRAARRERRNDMIEETSRQIEGIHPSPNPPEPAQKHPRPSGLRTGAIIGLILLVAV